MWDVESGMLDVKMNSRFNIYDGNCKMNEKYLSETWLRNIAKNRSSDFRLPASVFRLRSSVFHPDKLEIHHAHLFFN